MDFRKVTDELFDPLSHADLAKALGVSIPLIRQARLSPDAAAHRTPPEGWERAVADLAKARADHYRRLADKCQSNGQAGQKRNR